MVFWVELVGGGRSWASRVLPARLCLPASPPAHYPHLPSDRPRPLKPFSSLLPVKTTQPNLPFDPQSCLSTGQPTVFRPEAPESSFLLPEPVWRRFGLFCGFSPPPSPPGR